MTLGLKPSTKKVVKKMIEDNERTIEMIKISPALAIELLEKKNNFMRKQIVEA